MRAFKIDENRDIVFEDGKYVFVYDIDVVAQNCEQRMRQVLGELNYDADKGIDYFGNVFGNNPNFQQFEFEARTQLLLIDGVVKVNTFNYTFEDNILSYDAEIETIFGATTIEGSNS